MDLFFLENSWENKPYHRADYLDFITRTYPPSNKTLNLLFTPYTNPYLKVVLIMVELFIRSSLMS